MLPSKNRQTGVDIWESKRAALSEIRKLAAILVEDVVGNSLLAGADEEGRCASLRSP